ncbi:MAG TPA: MOSC and FAD-binding oxidoreductase domain-containing protein [Acetobacteraceae bacterium]|jgi:ferredoxin-NADP reductase/MOSC domain-containing protein YiiM|nr:MOSC and FAD-binding oxidoreductase domain-containing protein [Acetobacteraceae bacterium]
MTSVIVSVNVGLPQDVAWQGRTVRTAVWKTPVIGRVFARRLNLDGDGQGDLHGHGGEQRAIMVYQLDSYRYWTKHLGRPDLTPGNFGENLTVEGLADNEVCIGDRFRIGGAVVEVTQPRDTCYRVGIRLNNPQMAALLVAHHRPGFYFRVIEEGEIGAGDHVEKVADGPEHMTVAEIDALLYSSQHPVEGLRRAIRIPALSVDWQGSMQALLSAAEAGGTTGNAGLSGTSAPLAWRGFRSAAVVASHEESADVRSFEFAAEDGSPLPPAQPGQYLMVRVKPDPDAPSVTRSFSLCGPPGSPTYRIGVKNEHGSASGFLHQRVREGSRLEISAPRGSFTLTPGATPVVLISAGVGVTPVLAMLYAAAAKAGTGRPIWWLHGARDRAHHSFAREANDLLATLPASRRCIVYSRPAPKDVPGQDFDQTGHLSPDLLETFGVPRNADFYLCGPSGFLDEFQKGLAAWGTPWPRVHVELFGAAPTRTPGISTAPTVLPHRPEGLAGGGPLVTFLRSGLAVPWDSRFGSLLEFAEVCAVPVRWACRTGVCHRCESGLVEGELAYAPEPLDQPAEGNALICCSAPRTAVALDL